MKLEKPPSGIKNSLLAEIRCELYNKALDYVQALIEWGRAIAELSSDMARPTLERIWAEHAPARGHIVHVACETCDLTLLDEYVNVSHEQSRNAVPVILQRVFDRMGDNPERLALLFLELKSWYKALRLIYRDAQAMYQDDQHYLAHKVAEYIREALMPEEAPQCYALFQGKCPVCGVTNACTSND